MRVGWLDETALALMGRDTLKWSPKETGGPLFGYVNFGEIVITRAFLPGPKAWHFPWLYRPDRTAVQMALEEVYEESDGRERWVGSWHSHPLGRALPSVVDRRTAARISAEEKVRCPEPVMLIHTTRLAREGQRASRLGAFQWSSDQQRLEPLRLRPYSEATLHREGLTLADEHA